jgi:predicted DCC family thiol-disulfide oxidoreductase YuxK
MTQPHQLTLFFDGNCPFCHNEMKRLASWDAGGRLAFVDIAVAGFDPSPLGASMLDLNRELYSQRPDGTVLVGIDSMLAAYTLVDKGWMVLPLRVKWLRPGLRYLYRKFAINRYTMSRWLGYKVTPRCVDGVCSVGNPFLGK